MTDWENRSVLVTGGASFIGSTLVDALVRRGSRVRVVDDFTSGRRANIEHHLKDGTIDLIEGDLRDLHLARRASNGIDTVFHLAADHGGRGYVDLHQAECATNFALDGIVFKAAKEAGVEKIVFASSGCVYPNHLQADPDETLYLTEDVVQPPYDSDNLYGYAKLMGELTLRAYHLQYGMKTASCRYFTVYGPRGIENHAVIAMIARAFVRADPFVVWGNGQQVRNWTYIDDIVEGTIRVAEKIDDGTAVNLGTMERVRVIDAVHEVLRLTDYSPKIEYQLDMPTGPMNRVADNTLARQLLHWEPQTMFMDGLRRTFDWYFQTHDRGKVAQTLEHMLTER
jgi:nucleoside-diphosphate-sugar epimerase